MNWADFIRLIKEMGYGGVADSFEAVQKWLADNEHDTVKVDGADGPVDLKGMFDASQKASLDLSSAQRELDNDRRVTDAVEAGLKAVFDATGLDKKAGTGEETHDVKVGKDLLADDPRGGYDHCGDFLADVKAFGTDKTMSEKLSAYQKATLSTYANENVGADGGFAVPPETRAAIEVRVTGEDSLLTRCDTFPMSAQSLTLPDDEATPWGSSGIQAYWEGEAGAITQSKPALKEKRWTTRKVTALVPITDELAADNAAMGAYVNRKVGEVLDYKIGEAVIRGTGSGQPMGVLTQTSQLIEVAKETSQVADTFIGINAIKMMSRLYPPYRSSAIWLANPDTMPYLYRLAAPGIDAIGSETTGWGSSIFMPASGLTGGLATLLGLPIVFSQHCAVLGDAGDVILGSFAQGYGAGIRGGLESASSIHLWFDQSVTAFRFVMRMDGQPYLSTTIAPRAGSNTMSAFVVAAAR